MGALVYSHCSEHVRSTCISLWLVKRSSLGSDSSMKPFLRSRQYFLFHSTKLLRFLGCNTWHSIIVKDSSLQGVTPPPSLSSTMLSDFPLALLDWIERTAHALFLPQNILFCIGPPHLSGDIIPPGFHRVCFYCVKNNLQNMLKIFHMCIHLSRYNQCPVIKVSENLQPPTYDTHY